MADVTGDHRPVGPDAPLENFVVRIARAHTNDRQRGARTIDVYRALPNRFGAGSAEGRERIAAAFATLVDDGTLETTGVDGTTRYRLGGERGD